MKIFKVVVETKKTTTREQVFLSYAKNSKQAMDLTKYCRLQTAFADENRNIISEEVKSIEQLDVSFAAEIRDSILKEKNT